MAKCWFCGGPKPFAECTGHPGEQKPKFVPNPSALIAKLTGRG